MDDADAHGAPFDVDGRTDSAWTGESYLLCYLDPDLGPNTNLRGFALDPYRCQLCEDPLAISIDGSTVIDSSVATLYDGGDALPGGGEALFVFAQRSNAIADGDVLAQAYDHTGR